MCAGSSVATGEQGDPTIDWMYQKVHQLNRLQRRVSLRAWMPTDSASPTVKRNSRAKTTPIQPPTIMVSGELKHDDRPVSASILRWLRISRPASRLQAAQEQSALHSIRMIASHIFVADDYRRLTRTLVLRYSGRLDALPRASLTLAVHGGVTISPRCRSEYGEQIN
jgi:hypothetical protein